VWDGQLAELVEPPQDLLALGHLRDPEDDVVADGERREAEREPAAVPRIPMNSPCAQKHAATWIGRPPRAPRSPISRVLRTTEMRSELVTENAATITMKRRRKKIMLLEVEHPQEVGEAVLPGEGADVRGQHGVDPRGRVVLVHAGFRRTSIPWTVDPSP
jgi:hypothetical protein